MAIKQFGQDFLEEMKRKLDIELIGVASLRSSHELKNRATALLPRVRSVVVFGKEVYKEIVSLLRPSKKQER
jgi:hypothetical protein